MLPYSIVMRHARDNAAAHAKYLAFYGIQLPLSPCGRGGRGVRGKLPATQTGADMTRNSG